MWAFKQSTGEIFDKEGVLLATGYAGHGEGKNNPSMQTVSRVGPLPRGVYTMKELYLKTPKHGPFVIKLEPEPTNEMFGRSAFLVHGDSKSDPGGASLGCIIADRKSRETMWKSEDKKVEVVE